MSLVGSFEKRKLNKWFKGVYSVLMKLVSLDQLMSNLIYPKIESREYSLNLFFFCQKKQQVSVKIL